jgi:hypothetical protein
MNSYTATITETGTVTNSVCPPCMHLSHQAYYSLLTATATSPTSPPTCPASQTSCSGNCLDLSTDINNCGTCGNICPSTNGQAICSAGTCLIACKPGFINCSGNPATGCETDASNSPTNCGTCGNTCQASPNAGSSICLAGACTPVCQPGFANCDGNPVNGCEVNPFIDPRNCGMCGNVCQQSPNAYPTCSAGTCTPVCQPGYANCDGNLANGCEVNTFIDLGNCGGCGRSCPPTGAHSSWICQSGNCGLICQPGYLNCDNNLLNGCEVDPRTDPINCGGCGNVCPSINGVASCNGGVCYIACNAGFANCDGLASNGCETNLANSLSNCGVCGNRCLAPPGSFASCRSGACALITPAAPPTPATPVTP